MNILFDRAPTERKRRSATEKILDISFIRLTQILAFSVAGVLIWIAIQVGIQAQPAIQELGFSFLTTSAWNPPAPKFGVLPMIYGTIISSLIALLIAFPIGLASAIVLSEDFFPQSWRQILTFMIELLAAIPSVVYGLWGIYVLIPFLKPIGSWLHDNWGWLPLGSYSLCRSRNVTRWINFSSHDLTFFDGNCQRFTRFCPEQFACSLLCCGIYSLANDFQRSDSRLLFRYYRRDDVGVRKGVRRNHGSYSRHWQ